MTIPNQVGGQSEILVNNKAAIARTAELDNFLLSIGENPNLYNTITINSGCSNPSIARILVVEASLPTDAVFVPVQFGIKNGESSYSSKITLSMKPINIRPLHISDSSNDNSLRILDVTFADVRYNSLLISYSPISGQSNNLINPTEIAKRDTYYNPSGLIQWSDFLQALIAQTGLSVTYPNGFPTLDFPPQDYSIWGDNVAEMIDLVCAAMGMCFCQDVNTGDFVVQTLENADFEYAGYVNDIISGGLIWDINNSAETKTVLESIVPSAIHVNFPLDYTASPPITTANADKYPNVSSQFYTSSSSAGIPSGISGIGSVTVTDLKWGTKPTLNPGSVVPYGPNTPANQSDLDDRAEEVARIYYQRFLFPNVDIKYRGIILPNASGQAILGTITYSLSHYGPKTHIVTTEDYWRYGMNSKLYNKPRYNTLGNLLCWRGLDGSIITTDRVPLVTPPAVPTNPYIMNNNADQVTLHAATDVWKIETAATDYPNKDGVEYSGPRTCWDSANGYFTTYYRSVVYDLTGNLTFIGPEFPENSVQFGIACTP